MNFDKNLLRLYAVTDGAWLGEKTMAQAVREALEGGATLVQLREKNMDRDTLLKEAIEVKKVTDAFCVPLIIDDDIEVCQKSGAAGVHVGQTDMEASKARTLLGPDKILGVTAKTPQQARAAQAAGADYLGCGAVFGSSTKLDTYEITIDQLNSVCEAVDIPVVAIGGINENNILELKGAKMAGAAVVSAIFAQKDIKAAAAHMRALAEQL